MADIEIVGVEKEEDAQLIFGSAGFIKTAEDLYEAMVNSVPGVKFGIAFAEASGQCLVRSEGNDDRLRKQAEGNMLRIGAGHTFLILFKGAYPINIVNAIKAVNEVSCIHCATANAVQVVIAKTDKGRGVLGIVDGSASRGVETEADRERRRKEVRKYGYKL